MAFNSTNPAVVDLSTRKSHYDRVFDNTIALKENWTPAPLGGDYLYQEASTVFVPIAGAAFAQLFGTNQFGFTYVVRAMVKVTAGTGRIRLWNITLNGQVGSELTFTNTTPGLIEFAIPLASGTNQYRLDVRGTAASDLPRVWSAFILGA